MANVYVAIDPGMSGAVCILEGDTVSIHDTPLLKKPNGDQDYDISAMAAVFKPYARKDVVCLIEAVFSMTGQGVSSSFNFGRGKGLWEGIAGAYDFHVTMVSPQTWKKRYPELKAEKIEMPQILKDKCPSKANEKNAYKAVKKDYERLKRQAKAASKSKAREMASQLYPALATQFKKVNSDGRAEALLMALYVREQTQARSKKCRKKK